MLCVLFSLPFSGCFWFDKTTSDIRLNGRLYTVWQTKRTTTAIWPKEKPTIKRQLSSRILVHIFFSLSFNILRGYQSILMHIARKNVSSVHIKHSLFLGIQYFFSSQRFSVVAARILYTLFHGQKHAKKFASAQLYFCITVITIMVIIIVSFLFFHSIGASYLSFVHPHLISVHKIMQNIKFTAIVVL